MQHSCGQPWVQSMAGDDRDGKGEGVNHEQSEACAATEAESGDESGGEPAFETPVKHKNRPDEENIAAAASASSECSQPAPPPGNGSP